MATCEPYRPTSRTGRELDVQRLDDLYEMIEPLKDPDLLGGLMEMFDRHIGNSEVTEPLTPQWKQNLLNQRPDESGPPKLILSSQMPQ